MDFDSELSKIQGALMRANNTHNFMDLKYRAGHVKEIKTTVAVLFKLLSDKGYITDERAVVPQHTLILRRITFFLILNSDLIILKSMVDSDEIGHIIWVTPLISKCVLISFVTDMHLIEFYCEAIAYSYPPLSLELLELAAQNINYTTPAQKIKHVNLLVTSVYAMFARFYEYPLEETIQKEIFSRAHEKVHELLKSFLETPKMNKDGDKWNTDEFNQHLGHTQLSMFRLLMNCFNIFEKKYSEIDKLDHSIYLSTYYEYKKNDVSSNNGDIVFEYLSKMNELLLDTAKLCIMEINVDLFLSWFEYNETEDSDITLQLAVGEQAYALQQMIKNNPSLEHEIGNMLDAISKKPLVLENVINDADRNELLTKSNDVNNENQYDWLVSLIRRDFFFQDIECLDCAIEFIHILNETDCQFIIESVKNLLFSVLKNEYPNTLKVLLFASLSRLTHNEQVSCVVCMFSEREVGNLLELPDHDAEMTKFLNKLIKIDDDKLFELYKIFIQNPAKFYKKIINECTENSKATNLMLNVIQKLNVFNHVRIKCEFDISNYRNITLSNMSWLILKTVSEINTDTIHGESKIHSYTCLIRGLIEKNVLSGDILLLKLIISKLQYDLTLKKLNSVSNQLRVLDSLQYMDKYLAPLMVVVSQVLESVRWELKTYSWEAVNVIDNAVVLLRNTISRFIELKKPADKEFKWVSTKLSNLSPMTAYYYRELWPDTPFNGFFDNTMESPDMQRSLRYLLPRCTMMEFIRTCKYMEIGGTPNTAIQNVCQALQLIGSHELDTENSIECFMNCCTNLAVFCQNLVKTDISTIDKPALVENIVNLSNSLPDHLQHNCFSHFMFVMSECCSLSSDDSNDDMEAVKRSINNINNDHSKSLMLKILSKEKVNFGYLNLSMDEIFVPKF